MHTPTSAVLALPATGRVWRSVVTLLLAGGALAGTLWGYDDAWPFAPMKMYATSTDPDGAVTVLTLEVRVGAGSWQPATLESGTVGINRAEAEGQLPRFVSTPALLADLVATHARLAPRDPAWSALRVVRVATVLHDGSPTGEQRRDVVVSWPAH